MQLLVCLGEWERVASCPACWCFSWTKSTLLLVRTLHKSCFLKTGSLPRIFFFSSLFMKPVWMEEAGNTWLFFSFSHRTFRAIAIIFFSLLLLFFFFSFPPVCNWDQSKLGENSCGLQVFSEVSRRGILDIPEKKDTMPASWNAARRKLRSRSTPSKLRSPWKRGPTVRWLRCPSTSCSCYSWTVAQGQGRWRILQRILKYSQERYGF